MALTAQPKDNGRHPRYTHLVYFDIECEYGCWILTTPANPGHDIFVNCDYDLEGFGITDRDIERGFVYLSEDYLDVMEPVLD